MTDLIRSACLTSFPEVARSLGLQPLRLLEASGIDRRCLEDPDIRLPTGALGQLLEISARTAQVDDFGLRLAQTRNLSVLGPVGLLVREEPTVRDALGSLIRYIRLHNEALHLRLDESEGEAAIRVEIRMDHPVPLRQGMELAVGVAHRLLGSMIGPHWRPQVCFAHAAPPSLDSHRRAFGGRVRFSHEFNGIVCSSRDLDRALPQSDPTLARYARQHLDALLAQPGASIGDKVKQLVWLQLPSGHCKIERVARHMGTDRRTLHRRLAREGTTFSAIVEQVRAEVVSRSLDGSDRPLGVFAEMLGFSSLSAFSRWFRGRFEASPSKWKALRQSAGTAQGGARSS